MDEHGRTNGTGALVGTGGLHVEAAPDAVRDLAEGCVRFVKQSLGVTLDYQPETLSVLDHYLEQARVALQGGGKEQQQGVEPLPALLAHAAGAYFGEVVRRRYASWWRAEGDDPAFWQIQLEQVYLAFSPVQLMQEALSRVEEVLVQDEEQAAVLEAPEKGDMAGFEMEEGDRQAIAARLAELPEVPEAEYYAPSTRLEVIDIAVDAIRARRMAEDEAQVLLTPEDYER